MNKSVYMVLIMASLFLQGCGPDTPNPSRMETFKQKQLAAPNIQLTMKFEDSNKIFNLNLKKDKESFINILGDAKSIKTFKMAPTDYDKTLSICLDILRDQASYTLDADEDFVAISLLFLEPEKAKSLHGIDSLSFKVNFNASELTKELRELVDKCLKNQSL